MQFEKWVRAEKVLQKHIQTKRTTRAHPKSHRHQEQYYSSGLDKTKGLNQVFDNGSKVQILIGKTIMFLGLLLLTILFER